MPAAPRGKRAQKYLEERQHIQNLYEDVSFDQDLYHLIVQKGVGTLLLGILLVLIYLITAWQSGDLLVTSDEVLEQWGQQNQKVLTGEIWRLFSSILIHADLPHLLSNVFFLLAFGWKMEELRGRFHLIAIFFLTAIGGNLLTLSLEIFGTLEIVSVGASGGVQGVFAAVATILYYDSREKGSIFFNFLVFMILFTVGPKVNIFAHFGGMVAGLIIESIVMRLRIRS